MSEYTATNCVWPRAPKPGEGAGKLPRIEFRSCLECAGIDPSERGRWKRTVPLETQDDLGDVFGHKPDCSYSE